VLGRDDLLSTPQQDCVPTLISFASKPDLKEKFLKGHQCIREKIHDTPECDNFLP
jgi:hypothetical protein